MAAGSSRASCRSDWVTASRVLVVAGKGGVGSSTAAAVAAIVAARRGCDVLLVSVDGKPGLGTLLGGAPLTADEQTLRKDPSGGRIRARTIDPRDAFGDYLDLRGVGAVMRRAVRALSLDLVAASTPGLEHLMVLAKVKELERTDAAELIVVDAPPAGHAAAFLGSARATQAVVMPGPLRTQADEVDAMLGDPLRARAAIVTLAEETPVNEAIELSHDVHGGLGMAAAPLIVNGWWPPSRGLGLSTTAAAREIGLELTRAQRSALVMSRRFGAARLDLQREQLTRLDAALPSPRIVLPRLPTARLSGADLDTLADAMGCAEARVSGDHDPR